MHPWITILIYLCLANYRFITCAVTEDGDVLWSALLDLHSIHCGEIDMCHMTNSNHIEPSADLFPQPCCVPCSCSATCESNQNCCPFRMRFKSISDVISTPSDTGRETVITSERNRIPNELNTPLEHLQSGSDILKRNNDKRSNQNGKRNHSETLHIAKGLRAKTWFDNITTVEMTTLSVITAKILYNEITSKKYDINDNSSDSTVDYPGVQIACIRPQLFYRLNVHPDSDAYEMVTSCPAEFKDTIIVEKCRAGQSNENIADVIPMTSKLSGLSYVNKYCLFCNEHVQHSKSVDEWQINIVRQRTTYSHLILHHPQFLITFLSNHFCNVHFVPKNLTALRKCKLYDVISCNKTGLWENYDYTTEKVCNAGEYLPVIHTVNGDTLLFKNIACVLCNIHSGITNVSRLNCLDSFSKPRSRRILSVNYQSFGGFPASDKEDLSVTYIETASLRDFRSETCPDDSILLLVSFLTNARYHNMLPYANCYLGSILCTLPSQYDTESILCTLLTQYATL